MKKRIVCGSICIAVLLALGIFTLVGLNSVINNVILDGVVLAPETYDLWGANPGSSNTLTLRNFTFYNFTNPRGYLYRGQIPKFNQISNFAYQQRSNFTDYTYNADKSIINFNFWLYFNVLQSSRNVNQTVTVMNLAPLGFWNQLQTVDISALAIQGFGGLFVQMNNTIKVQAIGQGIKGQYLQQVQNWLIYCKNLEFSQSFCMFVWFDPFYGLNDQNNFEPWIQWFYFNDMDSGMALVEYFGFSQYQIAGLSSLFKEWSQALDRILGNWYCQGNSCQSYQLTLMQLGKGGLTNNPPTGDAVDSICDSGNVTCIGYPELFSFYRHVFLPANKQKAYQNLIFSPQTVKQLFTPYRGTLLNVGNLSELYKVGYTLQSDRQNKSLLLKLTQITHAETEHHAWVIWKYAKYFVQEFVLKTSQKGERKFAGMAGVFTQALYESITQFSDWLMRQFISLIVAQQIPDCTAFLSKIDTIDDQTAKNICQNVNKDNYLNYYQLVHPCLNPLVGNDFKKKYNLRGIQMQQLCDPYKESLLSVANLAHHAIYKQYKCSSNPTLQRCTPFEIGAKQFFNSQITLKPLQTDLRRYPSALTGKQWNKELQEFEYRNYLNEAYGNPWVDKQKFEDNLLQADLLSFDKFYSVPGVQDLLIEKNATRFEEKYYWKNATLLLGFARFLVIEVGFGGFVQKRTAHQLLFGYEDQFLKNLKEMDPMMGGDPSIQSIVMLNQPNSTLEQAANVPQSMYTGYSDPLLTRNYVTNRLKPYVTYNKTSYTGYQVVSQQVNPFKHQLYLKGTDAFQNLPMSTPEDNQYIYIDTLYRIAEMDYSNDQSKYGFDLLRYNLSNNSLASQYDYPPNQDFYQQFKGLMNLSFLGLPLFASQSHFLGTDSYWLEMIEMYDEAGQNKQLPNQYDRCYIITQPKSGVTFQALLYLLTSVYVQPDILLQVKPAMLPVFTIYRGANLTQSSANDVLGDLKVALAAPRYILIFCVAGILLIIVAIVCCIMRVKRRKEPVPSLLQSTDNVFDDEVTIQVPPKDEKTNKVQEKKQEEPKILIREQAKQQQALRVPLNQSVEPEQQSPKPVENEVVGG